MSESYGEMIGAVDALKWLMSLPEDITRNRVIARFRYECDKGVPVPRKYRPGVYGHKYDTWTCGNCGYGLSEPHYRYCPNCGFAAASRDNAYQAKRRAEFEQMVFDFGEANDGNITGDDQQTVGADIDGDMRPLLQVSV